MDAAQRKAWNDAMRTAAGHPPSSSSRRSSDRQKKQARRDKARKKSPDASSLENRDYKNAVRIDSLEGIVEREDEADDEYDENDDGGDDDDDATTGSKRKRNKKRGIVKKRGAIPKRMKARSLASILLEDAGRVDGTTNDYLNAEARVTTDGERRRERFRKFCPVTGLFGRYTDPKSGIPYANAKALEHIRERAPPWMNLGGAAAYSEAVKSLRNED